MKRALLALVAACGSHATPKNAKAPDAGISLAIYEHDGAGFTVVDDRRWIDVTGSSLILGNIDPGASLASLVIEPFSSSLQVGQCSRDRLPEPSRDDLMKEFAEASARRYEELRRRIESVLPNAANVIEPRPPVEQPPADRYAPVVRCSVTGPAGRYLVRLVYVTPSLRYRAQHDVEVTHATRAQVTSRFAVKTPVWKQRAKVVLYAGLPGAADSPREVARGRIELDGSTSVLAVPTREVSGELRRVYAGAVIGGEDAQDVMWGQESTPHVWIWLELHALRLAPGPVHVHLELPGEGVRDVDVPAANHKQDDEPDAPLRLPLWIDESLRGSRQRTIEYNDGARLTERFVIGIGNMGDEPRDVFVEERMRPATKRRLERAWPGKPRVAGDALRTKLVTKPGRVERTGYTITYEF